MKSRRFRVISLVLVLVLALQFVPVASAASISARYDFTGEELGYSGYAIVTKNDTVAHLYNQRIGTRLYHTSGSTTTFPAGAYTVEYKSFTTTPICYSAVQTAGSMIGVNFEFSTQVHTEALPIWPAEETGYYRMTTNFHGYSGSYDVFVDYYGVYELIDSAFYNMAANSCDGITGYVIVS